MLVGYTPGCWDLLHIGHVRYLEKAHRICGCVVVGVASDEVIEQDKGEPPSIPLCERMEMLNSLRCVHAAVAYYELDFIAQLQAIKPRMMFVGEQWGQERRHIAAEQWCKANEAFVLKLPYSKDESTTRIKQRIRATTKPSCN